MRWVSYLFFGVPVLGVQGGPFERIVQVVIVQVCDTGCVGQPIRRDFLDAATAGAEVDGSATGGAGAGYQCVTSSYQTMVPWRWNAGSKSLLWSLDTRQAAWSSWSCGSINPHTKKKRNLGNFKWIKLQVHWLCVYDACNKQSVHNRRQWLLLDNKLVPPRLLVVIFLLLFFINI